MDKPNISDNRGTGNDQMVNKGLRRKWKWLMQCELSQSDPNDRRRLPCQICFAQKKTNLGQWKFLVSDWYSSYEASVELDGELVVCREGIRNRADAQLMAESLAIHFAHRILRELE